MFPGMTIRRLLVAALALAASACGHPEDEPGILARLQAIPGLTVAEASSERPEYRYFEGTFEQPVDHNDPNGPTFQQRVSILHRDEHAPVTLSTNGYYIPSDPRYYEPTNLLDANQVAIEHRFFEPSRPNPVDWPLLTIEQAAADHHRLVEALKPIYTEAWINFGASKGGMTATYHRRFYPDDVDGTIAYVAPMSFGLQDSRYIPFVENAGGDPACTQALKDFQREVLSRRTEMLVLLDQLATNQGLTFTALGGPDQSLEQATLEMPFIFWQYFDASFCPDIPTTQSSDDEVFAFLDGIASMAFYADFIIEAFGPYYVQAAAQLGYPALDQSNVSDLLLYPNIDINDYLPAGAAPTYDANAMTDIADWVQNDGSELLFIYGQNDPWSAGEYALGNATDAYTFFVANGNHSSSISQLTSSDQAAAVDALERWTGQSVNLLTEATPPRPLHPRLADLPLTPR